MEIVIKRNEDNLWVVYIGGKPLMKQKNLVALSRSLWKYLKGQS